MSWRLLSSKAAKPPLLRTRGLTMEVGAAAGTDLGFRGVRRLVLEAHALGQHGAIVLAADVLI